VEPIRRAIRSVVGGGSPVYSLGSRFLDFLAVVRAENLATWRTLRRLQTPAELGIPPVTLQLRQLAHPMVLRAGTEDANIVISSIIREEYGDFTPVREPLWMVDAGAYIGDTSAYFLSRFRQLRVIALEPNAQNFLQAQKNLLPYGERCTLLKTGLWKSDGKQNLTGDSTGASIAANGVQIDVISIPTILRRFSIPQIDILKMDIEGAETAVFAENAERWLRHVEMLIIEIHGDRAMDTVSRTLGTCGFSMRRFRSVWYCSRLNAKACDAARQGQ
jgi:FkbM family methyltransferase